MKAKKLTQSESSKLNTRKRVQVTFNDPIITEQHHKHTCNINYKIKHFTQSGQNLPNQTFGYASEKSFHESMNIVTKSQENFALLPAKIRTKFDNNPAKLLQFLDNPENALEAASLGLIKKTEPKVSDKTEEPTEVPSKDSEVKKTEQSE